MTKEQSTRRYSMHEYHGQVLAEIDDGGTWVKHEDYERVVAELIGRIAALGGFRDEPSPEGRESMRRANEEAKLMAERFRKMHDISWEDLNRPFTI